MADPSDSIVRRARAGSPGRDSDCLCVLCATLLQCNRFLQRERPPYTVDIIIR